jgi:SAM-dependent methyltransferase
VCGLWRQDPQPHAQSIVARYGDDYLAYETARHLEYRGIALRSLSEAGLEPAQAAVPDGRRLSLLEIGCATGALLSAFSEAGWEATGVEVGPSMAAYARSTFGLNVIQGTLETAGLPAGAFNAVVATHLVEHLNDPRSFLREVRRTMRPDGALWLVTPNAAGFQARLKGAQWRSAIRDHLYLFSVRTLSALLTDEGYSVDHVGTWGGWPAGMRPLFLKKPVDAAAKRLGWGDVMVIRATIDTRKRQEPVWNA